MELLRDLDKIIEKEIKAIVDRGCVAPAEWDSLKDAVSIMEKSKSIQAMYSGYDEDGSTFSRDTKYMIERIPEDKRMWTHGLMPHYRTRSMRTRYDDGRYSYHSIRDRIIDNLERMYDEAGTDHERNVLDEMISYIRTKD